MLNSNKSSPEKIRNKVTQANDRNLLIDDVDAYFTEDGAPKQEKISSDLDKAVQVCETCLKDISDDQIGGIVDQQTGNAVNIFERQLKRFCLGKKTPEELLEQLRETLYELDLDEPQLEQKVDELKNELSEIDDKKTQ